MSDTPEKMDISGSPCSGNQFAENLTPTPAMKAIYSKIISSCKRNEKMSCSSTPENRFRRDSPFLKRKVPFNPFNHDLKERLENLVFSPNVFSNVISPSQDSETFKWTIDDLSKINPAQIEEEFNYEEQVDEQTECEIQSTIDKYFTKTHMVPSPWQSKLPTCWNSLREVFKAEGTVFSSDDRSGISPSALSPCSFSLSRLELVSANSSAVGDSSSPPRDVSTQTALSLPSQLPEPVDKVLKPYYAEVGDNGDDINLSINSLRRKLNFQQDREASSPTLNRRCSSVDSSPVINRCCPSTPLFLNRTDGSPYKFSPLDVSPISYVSEKTCNYQLHMTTPHRAKENVRSPEKSTTTSASKQFSVECYKVFESPKVANRKGNSGNARRSRKRRRSLSQDINMSVLCSPFFAIPMQTSSSKCSISENKMFVDRSMTMTELSFSTENQDTGYQTESANYCTFGVEKNVVINNSNIRSLRFECWMNENKENQITMSSPTK